jgi:hypothetical protein
MPDIVKPEAAGEAAVETPAAQDQAPADAPTTQTPETPKELFTPEQREYLDAREAQVKRDLKKSSKARTAQIEKEVSDIKAKLETGGAPLNPQQEAVIRQTIEEKIDGPDDEQPGQRPAAPSPDPNVDSAIDYLNSQIADVFEDVGTAVTKSDPEFKEIQEAVDKHWTDPKGLAKILRVVGKAAEKKAERVATLNEGAAARVIGGGGGQPSGDAPAQSASELWGKAHKK